jgi:hypothetical protein
MNQRVWVLGALLAGLLGCAGTQTRLQSEDESDRVKIDIDTVGKKVTFANADAMPVSGIGLVVGLDGTGGGAPPGGLRSLLETSLRQQGYEKVKDILDSNTTSIVLISGTIAPGAKKGDVLDLDISVPRDCKTSSLRGGRLIDCLLYNYASKKAIDPNYNGADAASVIRGHAVAAAKGQLIVGFAEGDESGTLRSGRIWSGGKSKIGRSIYMVLNSDQQFTRVAKALAERVNETFQGSFHGPATSVATAETKSVVYLNVPAQYKLNLPRYLRVVRQIPMSDTAEARIAYRRKLEERLLNPAHTVVAALKLEALGQDSVPILKRGLASDHALVQFCAAEALAYLGSSAAGEVLGRTVEQQPALRAFSLTALASLDEAICHVELRRLLAASSPETRYGAFRALRALDENEEAIKGEFLNESFWLHRVAQTSAALVHVSTVNRAEIVFFGDEPRLIPPFPILAGEFTVTAGQEDQKCTITRASLHHGRAERQCSLKLDDIMHTMAAMGGNYGDIVEVLRRADHLQCLSCPIAVDALPQAVSVEDLAKAGAGDKEALKNVPEILAAKADLGDTPTLFEKETRPARSEKPKRGEIMEQSDSGGQVKRVDADDPSEILNQPTRLTPERVHGGIQ